MTRKHRVLKLVHPGGFAEIHKNPITADEVMKKNPRHCVTRPDVFKFPWIVVRPESVLNIGSVFYIVPFHTIHCLLRRIRCPFGNTQLLEQQLMDSSSVKFTFFDELVNEQCPKASLRRKVDCKIDDFLDDEMFPKSLIQDSPVIDAFQWEDRKPPFKPRFKLEFEEFDNSLKKSYSDDDRWCMDITFEDCQTDDSFGLRRPSFSSNRGPNDDDTNQACRRDNYGLQSNNYQNENKVLKSCLKKENTGKSRGVKVKFAVPSENNEKKKMKTALELQRKFP